MSAIFSYRTLMSEEQQRGVADGFICEFTGPPRINGILNRIKRIMIVPFPTSNKKASPPQPTPFTTNAFPPTQSISQALPPANLHSPLNKDPPRPHHPDITGKSATTTLDSDIPLPKPRVSPPAPLIRGIQSRGESIQINVAVESEEYPCCEKEEG